MQSSECARVVAEARFDAVRHIRHCQFVAYVENDILSAVTRMAQLPGVIRKYAHTIILDTSVPAPTFSLRVWKNP